MKNAITFKTFYRKCFMLFILIVSSSISYGQSKFKGVLLNTNDSLPIQFAMVKSSEFGSFTQTDELGRFELQVSDSVKRQHLVIYAIGLRDTVLINQTRNRSEKIYINRVALPLTPFVVNGLRAVDIVRKAVEMIPENYTDSSFAAFSFYRSYMLINGEFKNLIEAQAIVFLKLSVKKKIFSSDYGFYIDQMRRSNYEYVIDDFKFNFFDFTDLLNTNPIYNLSVSSLNPNAFSYYKFSFDTLNKTDDYVIKYKCVNFSSEDHGISNYRSINWAGESWEEGAFVIDSKSFAFKKIERNAYRYQEFDYPFNNNYLLPTKKFYEKFIDANLVMEYQQIDGMWFLKNVAHRYTNEFYSSFTNTKTFTISDMFEWYCDSVSHYISSDLADKFYTDVPLSTRVYKYDKYQWNKTLPLFYYHKKEDVYKDIEKHAPIESQFNNNGK